MLDAKLVAVVGVMGVLVAVGTSYLATSGSTDSADSVDYTNDFAVKFNFICSKFDGGGCATEVCNQLKNGDIDFDTPLSVTCDGYTTTGTLNDMGNSDDWQTRASLVNSEEPLEATGEWCAKNGAADGGVSITDSTSEDMGECGNFHPIIAATINAEYDRYVAREHAEKFSDVLDMFCADLTDTDLQNGCEELRSGFKGQDAEFKVACANGEFAVFHLGDMVLELDVIKDAGGGEAEVQAYVLEQCNTDGRRLEDVQHIADFHAPALDTARKAAGIQGQEATEEMNDMATPEGRSLSTESLSDKLARLRSERTADASSQGRGLSGLGALLKEHVDTEDRALMWWRGHHHNPHRHSPHRHTPVPADCGRCQNKCGNNCYGRCGPGCTKWAACGCNGNDAHNACSHHDHSCSCGSMFYPSCMALGVTAIAPNWGVSWGAGCNAGNTFFNHAVMGWGYHFKGWSDKSKACRWDEMN